MKMLFLPFLGLIQVESQSPQLFLLFAYEVLIHRRA